ncbi:Phylloplanin [Rhynchospora pubera]|uniref:Phylloplanin n=1 Tax=Rhynchospora pubera TaxID=906938 RepID=A0AAV8DVV4_9POAL|nr:Phylloplanin [Rhynchospora pubera]
MATKNFLVLVVLLGVTATAVESVLIFGHVYCSTDSFVDRTSPLSNAVVQLTCGGQTQKEQATTLGDGSFHLKLDPASPFYGFKVINCKLVVDVSPLKCDTIKTEGSLVSRIVVGFKSPGLYAEGFKFIPKTQPLDQYSNVAID